MPFLCALRAAGNTQIRRKKILHYRPYPEAGLLVGMSGRGLFDSSDDDDDEPVVPPPYMARPAPPAAAPVRSVFFFFFFNPKLSGRYWRFFRRNDRSPSASCCPPGNP
jgi:hypothetical protein